MYACVRVGPYSGTASDRGTVVQTDRDCTCNYVVQYVYVQDRTRSDSCTVKVPGVVARGRDERVEEGV